MLKGKKPEVVKKRLKALFYGSAGVGKTMAAIQFPEAYLIDTERGAENDQYIDILNKNNSVIFQTNDFDEILLEIQKLLTEKHEFKTLIIDPITTVHNALLDRLAIKVGEGYGKHYTELAKYMKRLTNLLLRLDMNVIITSHAKNEYGDNMSVLGQTFDGYKKLDYIFDVVLEIKKENKKRIAVVKKSRISSFEEMDSFEFSYETMANKYDRKRIEQQASSINLASEDQLNEFNTCCDILKIQEDQKEKWLNKAQSSTFEEMSDEHIDKLILFMKDKIKALEDTGRL